MHRDGHIGIGLVVYTPLAFVLSWAGLLTPMVLGLVGVAFMSYAPDFDMQLPLVSHRGLTHTALAAGGAGIIYALLGVYLTHTGVGANTTAGLVIRNAILANLAAAGFGFLVGVLGVASHLLGDVLTPMGIEPWQPFDDRSYSLDVVYASNTVANEGLLLVGSVAIVGAITAGTMLRTGSLPL